MPLLLLLLLGGGMLVSACDGSGGTDSKIAGNRRQVTLSRLVAEIKGVENTNPTTPIEVYGESYALLNNAYKTPPDSAFLLLDGEQLEKRTDHQEISTVIPAARLSEGRHTLALEAYKTLHRETRRERDAMELTLTTPDSTSDSAAKEQ